MFLTLIQSDCGLFYRLLEDMLLDSVGSPHAQSRVRPARMCETWIGISACLGDVVSEGYQALKPTGSSTQAVVSGCKDAFSQGHLAKDEAASPRGKTSWASSHSAGRCGRIGTEVLKRKQYHGPAALSQESVVP